MSEKTERGKFKLEEIRKIAREQLKDEKPSKLFEYWNNFLEIFQFLNIFGKH